MKIRTFLSIAAVPALVLAGPALAAPENKGGPADTIHPNIHDKVGQAGNSDGTNANANPEDANANGGQIHGIGDVFGQNDANSPSLGAPGFADQLEDVHGGIGAYNPQVP